MKKKLLKFAILLLVFAAGSIFAMFYLMFSSLESVSVPSKEEICKITKLDLSDSVRIVGAEYHSSLDDSLYIALDITSKELEKLFPTDQFNPSTTIRYIENDSLRERKWFNPNSIVNFKSFQHTDTNNNAGMYVLYDNSNLKLIRVYIFWFKI